MVVPLAIRDMTSLLSQLGTVVVFSPNYNSSMRMLIPSGACVVSRCYCCCCWSAVRCGSGDSWDCSVCFRLSVATTLLFVAGMAAIFLFLNCFSLVGQRRSSCWLIVVVVAAVVMVVDCGGWGMVVGIKVFPRVE